jgi:hypothetical protein
MLIRIFGAVVALWVVLLLIGFVLPGHFRVERSAAVAARPAPSSRWSGPEGLEQVGRLVREGPGHAGRLFAGDDEVGSWSQWKSKSQGDGKMTISALIRPAGGL